MSCRDKTSIRTGDLWLGGCLHPPAPSNRPLPGGPRLSQQQQQQQQQSPGPVPPPQPARWWSAGPWQPPPAWGSWRRPGGPAGSWRLPAGTPTGSRAFAPPLTSLIVLPRPDRAGIPRCVASRGRDRCVVERSAGVVGERPASEEAWRPRSGKVGTGSSRGLERSRRAGGGQGRVFPRERPGEGPRELPPDRGGTLRTGGCCRVAGVAGPCIPSVARSREVAVESREGALKRPRGGVKLRGAPVGRVVGSGRKAPAHRAVRRDIRGSLARGP